MIFDKSGLPLEVISHLWDMADTKHRGSLNKY